MFVDGGHLGRHYSDAMLKWCGTEGELDLDRLRTFYGAHKCFYYDCVDDIPRKGEDDRACDERVAKQELRLSKIQRLEATHVRLGSVTGTRKNKRQKQVDILLAVDMLNHAVRANMAKAILITGDQDFKPLVDALVDMGLHVHLFGDHRHTSRDLADAADFYRPLHLTQYHEFSSEKFKRAHPIPGWSTMGPEPPQLPLLKAGSIAGEKAALYRRDDGFLAYFAFRDVYVGSFFRDENVLCKFCEVEFGPVEWSQQTTR
jgi:uncharacterized LabA/DUF88 family protein